MTPTWFLPMATVPPAATGALASGLFNINATEEYTVVRFERR